MIYVFTLIIQCLESKYQQAQKVNHKHHLLSLNLYLCYHEANPILICFSVLHLSYHHLNPI